MCHLDLPSGAILNTITAQGFDGSSSGYFEAAVWRTENAGFNTEFFGNFGGVWQSSGVAASPGVAVVPVLTGASHVIAGNYFYRIGIATRDPNSNVSLFGVSVQYTIP